MGKALLSNSPMNKYLQTLGIGHYFVDKEGYTKQVE
jgi:hypothetical protein